MRCVTRKCSTCYVTGCSSSATGGAFTITGLKQASPLGTSYNATHPLRRPLPHPALRHPRRPPLRLHPRLPPRHLHRYHTRPRTLPYPRRRQRRRRAAAAGPPTGASTTLTPAFASAWRRHPHAYPPPRHLRPRLSHPCRRQRRRRAAAAGPPTGASTTLAPALAPTPFPETWPSSPELTVSSPELARGSQLARPRDPRTRSAHLPAHARFSCAHLCHGVWRAW